MIDRIVVLDVARLEAAHLAGLVGQFAQLLRESAPDDGDPAIARLVPTAYADDEDAAREFRSLTQADLLDRRASDAGLVLASLQDAAEIPEDPDDPALLEQVEIRLAPETAQAWLRTLAAVRLVLATRLGVVEEDDHEHDDPRFGVYDWIGYRLDGLVAALDSGE
ncbi:MULTISPECIES: DUF2017 family protein [Microbacterium]|jgi:hypothetical protein|uniref:Uncharacterized protein n=1 Tax=Microbacterium trichothecenolyticum TaxID=69370 RepID=A0A0M2HN06_MICTR|nr:MULTISPECIES: DUF2017 family protein [Microbacterium]KJL45820.1 hypothetical protein RS82_00027 [Microbacterium trichothecenolyticum]MDR7189731.1 hypothetical protein [Microbacterium sp. BE35]